MTAVNPRIGIFPLISKLIGCLVINTEKVLATKAIARTIKAIKNPTLTNKISIKIGLTNDCQLKYAIAPTIVTPTVINTVTRS